MSSESITVSKLKESVQIGYHIVVDSRLVRQGDTFFATHSSGSEFYRGSDDIEYITPHSFDAHPFIADAIERGASRIVLSKPEFVQKEQYPNIEFVLVPDTITYMGNLFKRELEGTQKRIVGITGSTGKSTATEMVRIALGNSTYKHLSDRPTPISIPLKALNSISFYSAKYVVLEMPMDGSGQIEQLCQIAPPDVAVLLNINSSHIAQLGSIENIIAAKMELVNNLKTGGTVVINLDDPYLSQEILKFDNHNIRVLTFGRNNNADIKINSSNWYDDGFRVTISYNGSSSAICSQYIGDEVAYSMAAAVGVAISLGESLEVVCSRLSNMKALPGRMSLLHGNQRELILDDTRLATPQSTERLLTTIANLKTKKRKILIQGPILRAYQHGNSGENLLKIMEKGFDKVILFQDDSWLDTTHHMPLIKDQNDLVDWYRKHVRENDLVVINASEGIKLWEFVKKLVVPDEQNQVYDPLTHD